MSFISVPTFAHIYIKETGVVYSVLFPLGSLEQQKKKKKQQMSSTETAKSQVRRNDDKSAG